MKYALFDFVEDCSVEVGESAWIEDLEDCDDFDFDEECIVAWPTKKGGRSTRYGAKVIKFSDDRTELVRLANLYTKKGEDTDLRTPELGRGKREKRARRLSSDSEDDEEETVVNTKSQKRRKQVQKKASAQLLDRIQKEKKTSHLQKRVDSDLGSLGCTVLSRPSDSSSDDNSENRLLRKKVKNLEEENAALRIP
ncbi:uncharacterized protein [Ptychodera flava]|uniref:uncharacterized protein n=1 Tax=Ptychodera flava TaxID=63121 RepID=UPI003969E5FA